MSGQFLEFYFLGGFLVIKWNTMGSRHITTMDTELRNPMPIVNRTAQQIRHKKYTSDPKMPTRGPFSIMPQCIKRVFQWVILKAVQYLQYVQPLHHVQKHSSRHVNMLVAMAQWMRCQSDEKSRWVLWFLHSVLLSYCSIDRFQHQWYSLVHTAIWQNIFTKKCLSMKSFASQRDEQVLILYIQMVENFCMNTMK